MVMLDLEAKLEVESGLDSMSGIRPLAIFICVWLHNDSVGTC